MSSYVDEYDGLGLAHRKGMDNATQTETHPLYQISTSEREQLQVMTDRLTKAEREELTVTGMWMAWETRAAQHILAWRGAE